MFNRFGGLALAASSGSPGTAKDRAFMMAQLSVAFLPFLTVFLGNAARYSLRAGVFMLPFSSRFCQKRQPRRFYVSVCVTSVLALICFATLSGYVLKVAAS
jgi:hypothetical protein